MNELGLNVRIVLAVLAVWRVTHLLASEDGPGDLVFHLRARLGSSFLGRLMDCFYCLSLWVAIPFTLVVAHQILACVLTWLALSGAACLLERMTTGRTEIEQEKIEGGTPHAMLRPEEERP
jgi:protein-S-isoprenylcysteine O-methyltransferase Ste14